MNVLFLYLIGLFVWQSLWTYDATVSGPNKERWSNLWAGFAWPILFVVMSFRAWRQFVYGKERNKTR